MGIFTYKAEIADGVRVRISERARRMRLRVAPDQVIELVLPRGMRRTLALRFMEDSREWIKQTKENIRRSKHRDAELCRNLPEELYLGLTADLWRIEFSRRQRDSLTVNDTEQVLGLGASCTAGGRNLIRSWLKQQARQVLPPLLDQQAARTGLHHERVRIGLQKTRWGSCSSRATISLNAGLLLLSPELVRYLMVHELCHLRHLNHSVRFWNLVESYEPAFKKHDSALRRARSLLPGWMYCDDKKQRD